MSNHPSTAAQRAGESLLLGLLAVSLGAALVVDFIGALAGFAWNGEWAWIAPEAMIDVLGGLPSSLDDPRRAWPAATQRSLPGPVPMYLTTGMTIVAAAALVVVWLRSRRRQARPPAAEWAKRRQLRALEVDRPKSGRLVLGRARGRLLAAESRQSVLVVAPTQSGKTTSLAVPAILDWNGPVVATSIKSDLVLDTRAHRASLGDTHIFDPTGSTGLDGLSSWSPLATCRTWQGARRTAAWLTDAASPNRRGMAEGDFWYATAAKLLAPLLFAAATSGCTMEQVVTWLDRQEESEVLTALEVAGCHAAITAAEATWSRDARQKSSVYTTAETVIEAYADPGVLANSMHFDIEASKLLDGGCDTVYLCATARDQRRLRPVFVTLIQEILEAAYGRSAKRGKPLDPPLLIVLDEAANIAPLPDLDVIAATGAGQGVQLLTVLQDLAQAYDRWSRERADTIINNHRALLVGSGVSDARTLEAVGRLLGDQQVDQRSRTKGDGRDSETLSTGWRSLAPPNALREAAPGSAVLIYGTLPPAQLKLCPWYEDRRLRRLAKATTEEVEHVAPSKRQSRAHRAL